MLYDRIQQEYLALETKIHTIEAKLNSLPDGKFICSRCGNNYKWYRSDGKNKTYIPKKDRKLAEQLATKKYLSRLVKDLKQEKTALDFYLRHHSKNLHKTHQLLLEEPGYRELLAPYFKPKSQALADWVNASYKQNPRHPEHLIHKTASGNLVRSKSEVLIDLCLYKNNIPFRYECELQLGSVSIFPDFTIRHPKTGEFFYWEHFGIMDDPFYTQNVSQKLELYTKHGIIPTIHLITTYETKEHPLGFDLIEKIISHYFS